MKTKKRILFFTLFYLAILYLESSYSAQYSNKIPDEILETIKGP
jgi:hypothetical protein